MITKLCLTFLLLSAIGVSSASGADFKAQALPSGIWGRQVDVANHLGPVPLTISAKPVGKTVVVGEVEYWKDANDKDPTRQMFSGSITITTGKVVGTVKVRFKGIVTGSVVEVHVDP
jgi:hypothetical protein